MPRRWLYYFGTFNPVHRGHWQVLAAWVAHCPWAADASLTLIPSLQPPNKAEALETLLPFETRFRLLQASLADVQAEAALLAPSQKATAWQTALQRLVISPIEHQRQGQALRPSYTIETLRHLHGRSLPTAHELDFLLGEDAFESLPSWREVSVLAGACRFWVFPRSEASAFRAGETLPPRPNGLPADVVLAAQWLPCPQLPISATQLRAALQTSPTSPLLEAWLTPSVLASFTESEFDRSQFHSF